MFTEERIGEILRQLSLLRYPETVPAIGWKMLRTTGEQRPTPSESCSGWSAIPEDGIWGGDCEYYAFAAELMLPETFAGHPAELSLLTGCEGQWDATNPQFSVYINGELRQGFDVNHHELTLTECAKSGECFSVFLSAYTGVQNFHLVFDASLRTVDRKIEGLYYDLLVPWQTACLLDQDDTQYIRLIQTLNEAVNLLDLRKPGNEAFHASVQTARAFLREKFYTHTRNDGPCVLCVGHTHIDIAWLWTLSVTEDKAVRSFSTVLELMRRYPEYKFMSSQPQLYLYVKKNAPEIYEQIKARVAEGRWEIEGAMFVEPDCNLSSGESLVRQCLYGKRFFMREFGKDAQILWLPDVFGYSAALPQILKKCGVHYFMTTKISWNEVNKIPYDTFYWKGIDGTKVLSHFIPTRDYVSKTRSLKTNNEHTSAITTNYNGYLNPCQIKGAWQRYQQKELNDQVLCSFGYGDGGGGPTAEMLETQRRLAYGIPGCPTTKPATARAFFDKLAADVAEKNVPIWSGELYLEYHRATYTSMARNKRSNRRGEFAHLNLEAWASAASLLCGTEYPSAALQEGWEILMRNQFHDILPGSSIRQVYEDSKREYARLSQLTMEETDKRLQQLTDRIGGTVVWNPNGQSVSGFAELDRAEGRKNVQRTADGKYLAWAEAVPAKGWKRLRDSAPAFGELQISDREIVTPFAHLRLNEKGQIASWYDRVAERELLQHGKCGNVLMTYEDKPHKYDNWNLFDYYREKAWAIETLLSAEVLETGPYRCALRLRWRYLDTEIQETIYAYCNTPRVDFVFDTDWKEDQLFLKALFPLELNSTEATYEIQYGNVKRPTVRNTSWDQAKFEVCYHKWMDVSEGGYGAAFLNDCKYGVSIDENTVGLSLIKCGRYPNPSADREPHHAVYSVYPHMGTWQETGIVKEAYALNNPMVVLHSENAGGELPEEYALVRCDARNVMVDVCKKAEDRDTQILRLYEFENCRTKTQLRFPQKTAQVWLCDMLENRQRLLAEETDSVEIELAPFEICTLELDRGGNYEAF